MNSCAQALQKFLQLRFFCLLFWMQLTNGAKLEHGSQALVGAEGLEGVAWKGGGGSKKNYQFLSIK